MMDQVAKEQLAANILGTGNKGFLLVVFPEGDDPDLSELSLATNANNDTVIKLTTVIARMVHSGSYGQKILGESSPNNLLPE